MENLDMIVYTAIVVLLFILFGVSTFKEFQRMNDNGYTGNERGDDQKLFKAFLGRLFG